MTLLRIGDFSQLAQVSTRTLRLYDELDLLKPAQVENVTGYRFYAVEQMPRLNRILALKDLGFSLEQIADMLTDNLTASELGEMLVKKQAELEKQLEEEQRKIARVAARLRQIEAEGKLSPYEVIVKETEPLTIASIRRVVPALKDMEFVRGEILKSLYVGINEQQLAIKNPELAIYHNDEYVEENIDMELATAVYLPKAGSTQTHRGALVIRQLAASPLMATTIHHGRLMEVGQAITAIFYWAAQNDYSICGNCREVHIYGREAEADKENITVEIQTPIKRGQ
ncbi:MAG: MerR family transcriptional regulator [Chloroflexi bacterium]|nr:MerR family transcriptional regulator [Chloroflexota bacterium]